jgi:hypothetical protein
MCSRLPTRRTTNDTLATSSPSWRPALHHRGGHEIALTVDTADADRLAPTEPVHRSQLAPIARRLPRREEPPLVLFA